MKQQIVRRAIDESMSRGLEAKKIFKSGKFFFPDWKQKIEFKIIFEKKSFGINFVEGLVSNRDF